MLFLMELGAGKTSTFGMLTGDITPSSGTAFVSGYDIRTDMKSVSQCNSVSIGF